MNKSNDLKMRVKYYEHYHGDKREDFADGFALEYYNPEYGSEDDDNAWGLGTFYKCHSLAEGDEPEHIHFGILNKIAQCIKLGYEVRILDSLPVKYK